jgi:hypothetical protein
VEEGGLCVGIKLTADVEYDPLVPQLQAGLPAAFFETWQEAVAMCKVGDWASAKTKLEAELVPQDGPSVRMLAVMGWVVGLPHPLKS